MKKEKIIKLKTEISNLRMKAFFSSIELIRKANIITDSQSIGKKLYSYEFKGFIPKGNLVGVHIKEFSDGKNKTLKLISNFRDNKKV